MVQRGSRGPCTSSLEGERVRLDLGGGWCVRGVLSVTKALAHSCLPLCFLSTTMNRCLPTHASAIMYYAATVPRAWNPWAQINHSFLSGILLTWKPYVSIPHVWKAHLVTAFPPKVFTCRVPQSNLKRRYGNQPAEFKWIQVSRVVSRPGIRGLQHKRPPGRGYSRVYSEQRYLDVCA